MISPAAGRGLKRPTISPLRYPGGKSSLYLPLRGLLRSNGLTSGVYVEPYAGGAGAAVALLVTGQVQRIVINDLDPAIHAFWRAVVEEPKEFSRLIENARLDLTEWGRQREIYMTADVNNHVKLGFATFYLNRTNRSGALNGGVIGGQKQLGRYRINARFNKPELAERVRLIGLHASRITVHNQDGLIVIHEYASNPEALIYADPPYFDRSGSLYLNSFSERDHVSLAAKLNALRNTKWLLTYDDVPQVHQLYAHRRRDFIELNYSAHRVTKAREVMVYSDALAILLRLVVADANRYGRTGYYRLFQCSGPGTKGRILLGVDVMVRDCINYDTSLLDLLSTVIAKFDSVCVTKCRRNRIALASLFRRSLVCIGARRW